MTNKKPKVVCFGEVLFDVYPDRRNLGGAPFNVAAHVARLGLDTEFVSAVGKDDYGREIKAAAKRLGISVTGLQTNDYPTGMVQVSLDDLGKPTYSIEAPAAWDFIALRESDREMINAADAFIYGSLACRSEVSRDTLLALLKTAKLTVFDINLRQSFYSKSLLSELLGRADVLKVNDEEVEVLEKMFSVPHGRFYEFFTERFKVMMIVKTLGAEGAEVYQAGQIIRVPGKKITPVDTVGAGDAFLAAFVVNYLTGQPIKNCLEKACELGAYVATQPGAIPEKDFSSK